MIRFVDFTIDELKMRKLFFITSTKSPILDMILYFVLMSVFVTTVWMTALGICNLLSTFCIVLAQEFELCVSELASQIEEDGLLSEEHFLQTSERFHQLVSASKKVDRMLSPFVAVFLLVSLGMLCATVYALTIDNASVHLWMMGVVNLPHSCISAILIILLPPLASLNGQVRLSF